MVKKIVNPLWKIKNNLSLVDDNLVQAYLELEINFPVEPPCITWFQILVYWSFFVFLDS